MAAVHRGVHLSFLRFENVKCRCCFCKLFKAAHTFDTKMLTRDAPYCAFAAPCHGMMLLVQELFEHAHQG